MTIQTYPSAPAPLYGYVTGRKHRTLISEAESGLELRRRLTRFPKGYVQLVYEKLSTANRNIIQNFFAAAGGMLDPFWYVDRRAKTWVDEYVGRGGPFYVDGAIADDGGVQTNQTVKAQQATANDLTLLPAVPAVNDAYYFGYKIPFDKLTLTIGTQGAGTWMIVWEYYKSNGTWGALSGVSDGTTGFTAAAGDRDVTFTMPSDWADCSVASKTLYWIRARVSAYTSITTQPKGSYAKVNTKTYDLHCVSGTAGATTIYVDGTQKTGGGTDYTFVTGGGGAGADRITFVAYPAAGALITANFTGKLRLKCRFADDELKEVDNPIERVAIQTTLREIQW